MVNIFVAGDIACSSRILLADYTYFKLIPGVNLSSSGTFSERTSLPYWRII